MRDPWQRVVEPDETRPSNSTQVRTWKRWGYLIRQMIKFERAYSMSTYGQPEQHTEEGKEYRAGDMEGNAVVGDRIDELLYRS
jgi:hypothetical protein